MKLATRTRMTTSRERRVTLLVNTNKRVTKAKLNDNLTICQSRLRGKATLY